MKTRILLVLIIMVASSFGSGAQDCDEKSDDPNCGIVGHASPAPPPPKPEPEPRSWSLCNEQTDPQDVAVAYDSSRGGWRAKGWYAIAPGDCKHFSDIVGDAAYWYVHGPNEGRSRRYCIHPRKAFTTKPGAECRAPHRLERFHKVSIAPDRRTRTNVGGD